MKFASCFRVFLLFSFTLCQFSCSGKKEEKVNLKTITLNLGDDPTSFDPRRVRDLASITLMKMLYEGLTRINPEQKIELAIAENYEISEDLRTYTFTLRPTQATNGEEITAKHFEEGWKQALDPSFPCDNAFQMYGIKNAKEAKEGKVPLSEVGVRALDKYTLQVSLTDPVPYFLQLLTHPVFFPLLSQEKDKVISNGPFFLEKWTPKDYLEVRKNEKYWDSKNVKLDAVKFVMVPEQTELMMYEKGEIDWMGSPISTVPLDALKELKTKFPLHSKPLLATYFFRTNVESPPFTNQNFRRALSLSINREEIVENVLQGGQKAARAMVPPVFSLPKEKYFEDNDVESAKAFLAKACQEMGKTLQELPEISLMYVSMDRNRLIAQAVQQQWEKNLGIKVKLEALESKVYFSKLGKKDYQMACCNWFADFQDPITFLEIFKYKETGTNNTNWENKEYTRLLQESAKTLDPIRRKEILSQSEEILLKEMPIIPIYYFSMLYLKNDKIKNVGLSPLGSLDFKWADLQDEEKIMNPTNL